MILQKEKIIAYKGKRDQFLNQIKNNFDTFYDDKHNDLGSIIQFINYSDSFVAELVEAQNLNEAAQNSIDTQSDSISRIIRHHNIDSEFNKDRADKWLVNALILVVRDSNIFNGIWFTDGKKKVLKRKIVKS